MSNNIVQLTDYNGNNIYPIAGATAEGSITKTMLDEGVFVGAELSDPGNTAYVGTSDIQDSAVTTAKIADLNVTTAKLATGAVTSDKIDWTMYLTSGTGTLNSTYFSAGSCKWYKMGKMVVAYVTSAKLSQAPPSSGGVVAAISGLPTSSSSFPETFFILHTNGGSNNPLRLSIKPSSTDAYFHWTTNTVQNADIDGQIIYFTD